jgi:predicted site-specific integrase-resolvase
MLWTVNDLAQRLNIKPSTLYAWAAQGKIRCRNIHGVIRSDPREIDRWLASFSAPPSVPHRSGTRRANHADLDRLIASAIHQAYTAHHGETSTPSPSGKEDDNGAR